MRRFSADRGFGLLPDFVRWTSTRYACPGRERWESKIKYWLSSKQLFDNCFFMNVCYNIITPVITISRRSFYAT